VRGKHRTFRVGANQERQDNEVRRRGKNGRGKPLPYRGNEKSTARIHRAQTARDGEAFGCATCALSLNHQVQKSVGDVDLFYDALAFEVPGHCGDG
jgi:hypothetical protein